MSSLESDQQPRNSAPHVEPESATCGEAVDRPLIGEFPRKPIQGCGTLRPPLRLAVNNRRIRSTRRDSRASLKKTLQTLIKVGRLPLSGETNLDRFVRDHATNLHHGLSDLIRSADDEPIDPIDLVSVGTSLSRIIRLHPKLHRRFFSFETALLKLTEYLLTLGPMSTRDLTSSTQSTSSVSFSSSTTCTL